MYLKNLCCSFVGELKIINTMAVINDKCSNGGALQPAPSGKNVLYVSSRYKNNSTFRDKGLYKYFQDALDSVSDNSHIVLFDDIIDGDYTIKDKTGLSLTSYMSPERSRPVALSGNITITNSPQLTLAGIKMLEGKTLSITVSGPETVIENVDIRGELIIDGNVTTRGANSNVRLSNSHIADLNYSASASFDMMECDGESGKVWTFNGGQVNLERCTYCSQILHQSGDFYATDLELSWEQTPPLRSTADTGQIVIAGGSSRSADGSLQPIEKTGLCDYHFGLFDYPTANSPINGTELTSLPSRIIGSGGSGPGGDYLPLTGGTLSGDLTVNGDVTISNMLQAITGTFTSITTDTINDITLISNGDGNSFLSNDGTYKLVEGTNFEPFPTFDDFPNPGEERLLYLDASTGNLYFWNGTEYHSIDEGLFNGYLPLAGGTMQGVLVSQNIRPDVDGRNIGLPNNSYNLGYINTVVYNYQNYVRIQSSGASLSILGGSGGITFGQGTSLSGSEALYYMRRNAFYPTDADTRLTSLGQALSRWDNVYARQIDLTGNAQIGGDIFVEGDANVTNSVSIGSGAGNLDDINVTYVENNQARDGAIYSLTYAFDKFVGVGANAISNISTDAKTWTEINMGTTAGRAFHDVKLLNGILVAVGDYAEFAYSTDGDTWISTNSGETSRGIFYGVSYGNSKYVAVGPVGTVAISDDAINWSFISTPNTTYMNSVTFGNGRFVAVGGDGQIMISVDGENWEVVTSPVTLQLRDVVYSSGKFIAVGNTGTVIVSQDAENWTVSTTPTTTNLFSATLINDLIVVLAINTFIVSFNGEDWRLFSPGTISNPIRDVAYGNGIIVALYGTTTAALVEVSGDTLIGQLTLNSGNAVSNQYDFRGYFSYNGFEILTTQTGVYYETNNIIKLRDGTKIIGRPASGGVNHELFGLNEYTDSFGLYPQLEVGSQGALFNVNLYYDENRTLGHVTADIYNSDGTYRGKEVFAYISDIESAVAGDYLPLTGGTMNGSITLPVMQKLKFGSAASEDNCLYYNDDGSITLDARGSIIGFNIVTGTSSTRLARYNGYEIATVNDLDNLSGTYLPLAGGTLAGEVVTRNLIPDATNTRTLGTSTQRYQYLWCGEVRVNTIQPINTGGDGSQLGSPTSRWANAYFNAADANTIRVNTSILINGGLIYNDSQTNRDIDINVTYGTLNYNGKEVATKEDVQNPVHVITFDGTNIVSSEDILKIKDSFLTGTPLVIDYLGSDKALVNYIAEAPVGYLIRIISGQLPTSAGIYIRHTTYTINETTGEVTWQNTDLVSKETFENDLNSALEGYLPLTGGQITGDLTVTGDIDVTGAINNVSLNSTGDGTKYLADDGTYKAIPTTSKSIGRALNTTTYSVQLPVNADVMNVVYNNISLFSDQYSVDSSGLLTITDSSIVTAFDDNDRIEVTYYA